MLEVRNTGSRIGAVDPLLSLMFRGSMSAVQAGCSRSQSGPKFTVAGKKHSSIQPSSR